LMESEQCVYIHPGINLIVDKLKIPKIGSSYILPR